MFCSIKCRNTANKCYAEDISVAIMTEDETKNVQALRGKFYADSYISANNDRELIDKFHKDFNRQTVFDYDLNGSEAEKNKNQLKCLFGLKSHKLLENENFFANYLVGVAQTNSMALHTGKSRDSAYFTFVISNLYKFPLSRKN
jgi:hypothetical protein